MRVHAIPAPLAEPKPIVAPFRSKRAADVATAAVLLALGVLVVVSAVRMGIGWGSDGPESGFVPFWLAVILIACCTANVVRAIRRRSEERFVSRAQLACVLEVLLPASAMILLTPFLGLYVAGAIYAGVYMRWVGRHRWVLSIALPLTVTVLLFLVFEKWFLVPLPKGPLEAWLGY